MLLDQYMPEFDFREVHQTRIDPRPAALYDLVRHLDFSDSAITRVLFRLRGLATTRMDLDRILQRGEFRLLDEQAGREFVLGGIGSRFLRLVRFESARDFQEHRAPGAIKVTWNFTVTENADGGATVRTGNARAVPRPNDKNTLWTVLAICAAVQRADPPRNAAAGAPPGAPGPDAGGGVRMRAGTMVLGIGVIHCLFGFVVFYDTWADIFRAGIFDSIGVDPMRGAVVWFFLFGLPVISYGTLLRWTEIQTGTCPTHVGWHLLVLMLCGVILMPASGFWLLLVPLLVLWKREFPRA